LVTLRKGRLEGTWVAIAAILPVLAFAVLGYSYLSLLNNLLSVLTIWVLALVLRRTTSWSYVLVIAAGLGVMAVLAIHGYSSNVDQWWQQKMMANMQTLKSELALDTTTQQALISNLASIATGIIAVLLLLMNLGWLLLARNWQAVMFNPGQLRPELQNIRMPKWLAVALGILIVLGLLTQWQLCFDVLPVVLLPFVLAGVSLVHFIINVRKLSWFWLVVFYILLVLFLPYWAGALAILALTDSMVDLRRRVMPFK
jgi:hypothetical protein